METLIRAENLSKLYFINTGKTFRKTKFTAVNDVSFSIGKGEVFGLVGESGCGKSTLALLLLRLANASSGSIYYKDVDISELSYGAMRKYRKNLQVVFQDPYDSLDPRFSLEQIMEEPLKIHHYRDKGSRRDLIVKMFSSVGLGSELLKRYPHQLSGGQRQRLCIARSLILSPEFLVCDEAVAALDVSVQAQILNLLLDLKDEFNLTYLFISHNLSVVKFVSDRIGVMYFGNLVEMADTEELFRNVRHPYTAALLSASPDPDPESTKQREILGSGVPSIINPPSGCVFHPRCKYADEHCSREAPVLRDIGGDHLIACHKADMVKDGGARA
ncbi:MAG: ATP-binding cassette domain-containing protein [Oscillospiraceae bacterium]|nr:ATP-binding cassette domain-containing protein [Oscillospiraceae bacterium]MCL2126197.1 ATP-binding cassette domain-containing protein [Oscillospiraceae bacterium]